MAVDTTNGQVTSAYSKTGTTGQNIGVDKSVLGKDDFLKLLLVELQNQDPTSPQDTAKILEQTSQLATLEASQNTNESLSKLSSTIGNSSYYSTIGSIGKMADSGVRTVSLTNGKSIDLDIYFSENVQSGQIEFVNSQGVAVETIPLSQYSKGINSFSWDGKDQSGKPYEDGKYTVNVSYTNSEGATKSAEYGVYPIESVRFNNGTAEFKMGNSYVALSAIKEIKN